MYKSLIHSVESNHTCRCIGIYGKWGEGKSTFMNFIKERFRKECINKDEDKKTDIELRVSISDFNPWLANNDETLMWDFFNTISKDVTKVIKEKLAKYSSLVTVGTNLVEAASTVAMGISPTMTTVGMVAKYGSKGVRKAWNAGNQILSTLGNKTLSERKKEISDELKKTGIHRFIFIDDIDRLDKEEIHTVFRLIREVADFDNVTYLIAMDPDIVAKSLSVYFGEGKICDGRNFIDKIIQVPIQLPLVNQLSLKNVLKEKLKDLWGYFRCGDNKELDALCQDLSRILVTQRQIIRFINQISFVIPALVSEVNMIELCYLEAIKIIDIQAYLRIANNRKALLKEVDEVDFVMDEEAEQIRRSQAYTDTLNDIVKDISMPVREIVRGFIDDLFTPNSTSYQLDLDQKKLCTGIYFATYFAQHVPENIISECSINGMNRLLSENRVDESVSIFNEWYHNYGISEVERVVLSIVRKFEDRSKRSEVCQNLIKIIIHTDVSQNYGYTLIDTPNGFTIFVSKELLIAYIRKRIETYTDVRLDDNDIYALLSSIYEDSSLPMPFLLDLHARINEDFVGH